MNNLNWIFFIAKRFSLVDRKGNSSITTKISMLGICFGVMTLIVVMSVMNGFQMSFIDSIMEISSYHIRVTNVKDEELYDVEKFISNTDNVKVSVPILEAQCLMDSGKQTAAFIRAVPENICKIDKGFAKEAEIMQGEFDVSGTGKIVLGIGLAKSLSVLVGDKVSLLAMSGASDTELISDTRIFVVTGIFRSGYSDINSSYCFISFNDGKKYFGKNAPVVYSIKLNNQSMDEKFIYSLQNEFPNFKTQSWREYNRSFFSALRIEKNMLLLLVILIFVVVGINIFNSMRRLVYERRLEIATLSALGGKSKFIQSVFVMRGFITGFKGAIPGLILGLLISTQMKKIFSIMSEVIFYVQYFFAMLFSPSDSSWISENPMYMIYAKIPARINFSEVAFITLFGIFSSTLASFFASKGVLKMNISEVLHES